MEKKIEGTVFEVVASYKRYPHHKKMVRITRVFINQLKALEEALGLEEKGYQAIKVIPKEVSSYFLTVRG